MIIFLWIVLRILLIAAVAALLWSVLKSLKSAFQKQRLAVELYVWITCDDDHVCEDCRERALWPAMDIADWMKKGLPRTPEACTPCGDNCRCELVRDQSRKSHVHDF